MQKTLQRLNLLVVSIPKKPLPSLKKKVRNINTAMAVYPMVCWVPGSAQMCGLPDALEPSKISSHLMAVHKYNLKENLSEHANPQRPAFALGDEGGLILCSWPKGGKLSLPFVYSDEVWTGIEHQVASHLMLTGHVQEGMDILRLSRNRYDGRVRNPFNEYECGHWYARALSSYGYLQALTGVRYDAVEKTLIH